MSAASPSLQNLLDLRHTTARTIELVDMLLYVKASGDVTLARMRLAPALRLLIRRAQVVVNALEREP